MAKYTLELELQYNNKLTRSPKERQIAHNTHVNKIKMHPQNEYNYTNHQYEISP